MEVTLRHLLVEFVVVLHSTCPSSQTGPGTVILSYFQSQIYIVVYVVQSLRCGVYINQLNDCLQNTTAVCYPSQNPVRNKIQSETKYFCQKKTFVRKKNFVRKKLPQMLSWISSAQSELSRTNQCLSSLSGIFILQ